MDKKNSLISFLENDRLKTQYEASYQKSEEPFQIVYNARSINNMKPRKASYCKISESAHKLKKPRKMTLPIENTTSQKFCEEFIFETYSNQNLPFQSQSLPQQQIKNQEDINSIDLEKGIQGGIVEQSELDKESWFGIKNQNPEFDLME